MAARHLENSQPLGLASILACVSIATVRGLNPVAIKVVLLSMPPLLGAFLRVAIASAGIWVFAAVQGISLRPRRGELLPLALLSVIFAVQISANQTGADFTSPVLLAILFNTYPITTNLISAAVVPEDRLNLLRATGLVIAFCGVAWVLTARTESPLAPNPALGNALVLTAATLLAIRMVYTRQLALRILEADDRMAVWWGAPVEYVAALSRRERDGSLTTAEVSEHPVRLHALSQVWYEVQPSRRIKIVAQRLLRVHPLRAADSLQLASALIASEDDPTSLGFVCFDARLNQAASRERFTILTP